MQEPTWKWCLLKLQAIQVVTELPHGCSISSSISGHALLQVSSASSGLHHGRHLHVIRKALHTIAHHCEHNLNSAASAKFQQIYTWLQHMQLHQSLC